MPITQEEIDAVVDGLVPAVKEYVARTQEPIVASIDALLKMTAELERRVAALRGEK